MEELQSTELLDREILEDARKKAHRILKTAEDTIQAKLAEWEQNLSASLAELEEKYAQQGQLAADEIMARLPIDKRRTKAKQIEALLRSAAETWYGGLSRGRVLDLLRKELEKRLAATEKFNADGGIRAQIHQIGRTEAQTVLQAVLPGKACTIEEIHSVSAYPEIILETPQARIYASIGKIVDFLLGEKRAELVEALLGKEVLLDQMETDGGKR
ncbi:MAG: ATPase [Treponema sp.]|jgi:hypothetical protein|nr:ATPase [Treponema sp.]